MQRSTQEGSQLHSFDSFSSLAGVAFCRAIASRRLSWPPHDYQLEGACKALNGMDVPAIMPTGSAKTGILLNYMLVAQAIGDEPTLCPPALRAQFRRSPSMVVVCPTKALA